MNWRRLLWLVAVLLAISLSLLVRLQVSNCGGNSAALSQVRQIALTARIAAEDAPDHTFRFNDAGSNEREMLQGLSYSHWVRSAHFLVSSMPVQEKNNQAPRLIVVCDKPYRNVPRQWIGSAAPTHAAGYADGRCGLISTQEFAALDLSTFIALDELYPPKNK